jgi:hypothetical protein
MAKDLHCYEYVNRPFEHVRDALTRDAGGIFERATRAASGRADALVANLKVSIAGLEVGKNVVIEVLGIEPAEPPGHVSKEGLRVELAWRAETNAALFPSMRASLLVYALSPSETQLDLHGSYEPPGGILGGAADRAFGHRIAQATVHRFLDDVATQLGSELA